MAPVCQAWRLVSDGTYVLRTSAGGRAGDKGLIHRIHVHTNTADYLCQKSPFLRPKIQMCKMREGSWLRSGLEEKGLAGVGQCQLWTHGLAGWGLSEAAGMSGVLLTGAAGYPVHPQRSMEKPEMRWVKENAGDTDTTGPRHPAGGRDQGPRACV